MKFSCIADEDTARGFRLAGVEGFVVNCATEAGKALKQAAACPELGIVILTQQVAGWIHREVETFRWERDRPLLVVIPGPGGPIEGYKPLRHLVHSAVGIHLDQGKGA